MKRIMSIIFAIFMVAVCSISGGVLLAGCGSKKDSTPVKDENDSSISTTATGNWDSYYASSFAGGSGTSSSPYLISTPEQLARMAYMVNSGSGISSYYKLTTDIDISAHYWTPIGINGRNFRGTFDGDNYCIIGMTGNSHYHVSSWGSEYRGYGFFGGFSAATIKNFSIVNANINFTVSGYTFWNIGFVCSLNDWTNGGSLTNIRVVNSYMSHNYESKTQSLNLGGIIAFNFGKTTISSCCLVGCEIRGGNSSTVPPTGETSVGGIIGQSYSTDIYDCFFNGHIDVYSVAYGGGIVGYIKSDSNRTTNVANCYYVDTGYAYLGSGTAGGICGRMANSSSYIKSCFVDANITTNAGSGASSITKIKGSIVGEQTNGYIYYCCWYSGKSPNTAYGSQTGGTIVGCKSYSDQSLPKSAVTSSFYTSSSYLYGSSSTYGRTWSSSTWFREASGNFNMCNKGYLILKGSYGEVTLYENETGRGKETYYFAGGQSTSYDTTQWTNGIRESHNSDYYHLYRYFIYGQTMRISASPNIGYQFSNWTLNSSTGGLLSTSTAYNQVLKKGMNRIYANYTGRNYTVNFNSNGGMISDMSMWNKYAYGERFNSISYNSSTGINTISLVGDGGWEILGCPVTVSTNTTYTFSFDYQANGFTSLDSDHTGLPIMITTRSTGAGDSDADLKPYSLATSIISPSSSSTVQRRTVSFNSGSNSTVYLVVNFGWLADGVTQTVRIGNFKLLSGGTFNMIGTKTMQYGSTTNNTLSVNVSKKAGYTQTRWSTASSGGYEQFDSQGGYVSGGRNNYISNLNNWTKYFGYESRYSISYNSADSSKMSTFTCTGQSGWEVVGIPLYVSQNTSYTLTFSYSAGSFSIGHHDGIALQVVPSVVDSHMEDTALMTTIITPNSSGTRTVSFSSGTNSTVYLVLNGGWFNDGTSCSVSVGKFEFTGAAIPQTTNYLWTSEGKWAYPGSVTLYAQYASASYTVTLRAGTGINYVNVGTGQYSSSAASSSSGTYSYNSIVNIHAYAKPGYTFSGWTISSSHVVSPNLRDRNTQNTSFTMIDENVTLTANATANYYPVAYNTQGGSYPSGGTSTQTTAAVTNISVTNPYGYHFKLNAAGYYESTNQGVNSSYAIAKVSFQTTSANQSVYFDYINYGESTSWDYGVFGNLDTAMNFDSSTTNGMKVSYNSNTQYTKTYTVASAGTHFVYVKYIKDGSNSYYNDSLQFKVRNATNVIVETPMPFVLGSDGYYTSTNNGIHNSYAIARVNFTTNTANQSVTFNVINSGETGYDFGMISNLDSTLSASYTADSSYFYKGSTSSTSMYSYTMTVPTAGSHFVYIKYRKDGSNNSGNDSFKFKISNTTAARYGSTYGTLNSTSRTHYTHKGWYTASSGGSQVTTGSAFSSTTGTTLYAQWTPIAVSVNVYLRVISKNGSTVTASTAGGTVKVEGYQISGSTSNFVTLTTGQTSTSSLYSVHQGQTFRMTATANSGYVFAGVTTGTTPSPTAPVNNVVTYNPYSSTTKTFSYYVFFKQVSSNQLKYDETDKYFYFEDGYYPQSEAREELTKMNFNSGIFSCSNGIMSANGSGGSSSNAGALYSWTRSLREGDEYILEYELLSGTVSGNGCFVLEVYTSSSGSLSDRNVVDVGYPISKSGKGVLTISSVGASEGGKLSFWIYNSSNLSFNNAVFKIDIKRKLDRDLNNSATATGESINISQPFPTDMRNWTKYQYADAFKSISFNANNNMNVVTVTGGSGWEIIGYPVSVATNTTYTLTFDYQANGFSALDATDHTGLPIMVTTATSSSISNDLRPVSLATSVITPSTSSTVQKGTITFNSGSNSTIYVVINCGWLADYTTHTITVGNFSLSGGYYNADKEIPVYSYNGERYAKVTAQGETKWFKFEPIRWRISDYGVEKTGENIDRYKTLLKFKNYTSYATDFVAVSDLILGVGAMNNTRAVKEGDSVTDMIGFQSVRDTLDSLQDGEKYFTYAKSGNVIKVDNYSTYSQNNTVTTGTTAYSSPLRIASLEEINTVGLANKQARASDMVAFILGLDKNQVTYWTRDLSNLGSGVAVTASGTVTRPWLDQMNGMRFAYTFTEGSNVEKKIEGSIFETYVPTNGYTISGNTVTINKLQADSDGNVVLLGGTVMINGKTYNVAYSGSYLLSNTSNYNTITISEGVTLGTYRLNTGFTANKVVFEGDYNVNGSYNLGYKSVIGEVEIKGSFIQNSGVYPFGGHAEANVNTLRLHQTTPPSLRDDYDLTAPKIQKILVPASSVEAYKRAPEWSDCSSIIEGY